MLSTSSLSEKAEDSEYKISVLYSISSVLHSLDSLEEVIRIFPEILMENFLWKGIVVVIFKDDSCGISLSSFWGTDNREELQRFIEPFIREIKHRNKVYDKLYILELENKDFIRLYLFPIRLSSDTTYWVVLLLRRDIDLSAFQKNLELLSEIIDSFAITLEHRFYKEELERKVWNLYIISEVSKAILETVEYDNILAIMLSVLTAKYGLGFNRAFFFEYDKKKKVISGRMAIGPYDYEEAERIWKELEDENITLEKYLRAYRSFDFKSQRINSLIEGRSFSFPDEIKNLLMKEGYFLVLGDKSISEISDFRHKIEQFLGNDTFLFLGLSLRGELIGCILLDNFITHKPISRKIADFIVVLLHYFAIALDNSRLLSNLENKALQLEILYEEAKLHKAKSVEAEKLIAMGTLLENIADKLRNPIVAIGGLSKLLLREKLPSNTERLVSAIREKALEVEGVLREVLSIGKYVDFSFKKEYILNVIRGAVRFVKYEFLEKGKNKKIRIRMLSDVPMFYMDPEKLFLVFKNVLHYLLSYGDKVEIKIWKDDELGIVYIDFIEPSFSVKYMDSVIKSFLSYSSYDIRVDFAIIGNILRAHKGSLSIEESKEKGFSIRIILPIKD
jgi:signal transduction histidine kinase